MITRGLLLAVLIAAFSITALGQQPADLPAAKDLKARAGYRISKQCWSYDSAVSEAYYNGQFRFAFAARRDLKKLAASRPPCTAPTGQAFHYRPYPLWRFIVFPVFLHDAISGA